MFRPRILVLVVAAVLAPAMSVGVAGAHSPVTEGLLLVTDAAYAQFVGPVDDCHGMQLFVGYLDATAVKGDLSSGRPDSTSWVDVELTVFENIEDPGCGSDILHLVGSVGTENADAAQIVSLESASLDGLWITLEGEEEDPVFVELTVDLRWSANGDIITEGESRRVDADVSGTVSIDRVSGGGDIADALASLAGSALSTADLEQTWAHITKFQEIQLNSPEHPTGPPSAHPDLEGIWVTIDCAQWWEDGEADCSKWGDGSSLSLTIGPGGAPVIILEDNYSYQCDLAGLDMTFTATGTGDYVNDGIWLNFGQTWCGSTAAEEVVAPWSDFAYYDSSGGSLWSGDPDGDGWGYDWDRL
jgi:hypothetical protein